MTAGVYMQFQVITTGRFPGQEPTGDFRNQAPNLNDQKAHVTKPGLAMQTNSPRMV